MSDAREAAREMHDHLERTAEYGLPAAANRWLGEAEAVAADAASAGIDPVARRERAEQVLDLLSHVEHTGTAAVDEHVAAARAAAERVREAGES